VFSGSISVVNIISNYNGALQNYIYTQINRLNYNENIKIYMVVFSDAIINPRTMMIECINTSLTYIAMSTPSSL
jgi:hypothetical protein